MVVRLLLANLVSLAVVRGTTVVQGAAQDADRTYYGVTFPEPKKVGCFESGLKLPKTMLLNLDGGPPCSACRRRRDCAGGGNVMGPCGGGAKPAPSPSAAVPTGPKAMVPALPTNERCEAVATNPAGCAAICGMKGSKYAQLLDNGRCHCGDTLGKRAGSERDCASVCKGGKKATTSAQPKWKQCAKEKERCQFSGTKLMRFGNYDQWFYKVLNSGDKFTECNYKLWGDPLPKNWKKCEYEESGADPTKMMDSLSGGLCGTKDWGGVYEATGKVTGSERLRPEMFEADPYDSWTKALLQQRFPSAKESRLEVLQQGSCSTGDLGARMRIIKLSVPHEIGMTKACAPGCLHLEEANFNTPEDASPANAKACLAWTDKSRKVHGLVLDKEMRNVITSVDVPDENRQAKGVACDPEGNIYFALWEQLGSPNAKLNNMYMAKYSPSGKKLWESRSNPDGWLWVIPNKRQENGKNEPLTTLVYADGQLAFYYKVMGKCHTHNSGGNLYYDASTGKQLDGESKSSTYGHYIMGTMNYNPYSRRFGLASASDATGGSTRTKKKGEQEKAGICGDNPYKCKGKQALNGEQVGKDLSTGRTAETIFNPMAPNGKEWVFVWMNGRNKDVVGWNQEMYFAALDEDAKPKPGYNPKTAKKLGGDQRYSYEGAQVAHYGPADAKSWLVGYWTRGIKKCDHWKQCEYDKSRDGVFLGEIDDKGNWKGGAKPVPDQAKFDWSMQMRRMGDGSVAFVGRDNFRDGKKYVTLVKVLNCDGGGGSPQPVPPPKPVPQPKPSVKSGRRRRRSSGDSRRRRRRRRRSQRRRKA